MDLKLITTLHTAKGIFGFLTDTNDNELSVTLQHAYQLVTGDYEPKLMPGIYICVRGNHNLNSGPISTFEVMAVPGHTGILFHYGNYNDDSEGCILLGTYADANQIYNSRVAFDKFMKLQTGVDSFTLTVE